MATKDERYTGPRCAACNDPATCRRRMHHFNNYDSSYYCDDCCAHGERDRCDPVLEAEAARDAQGQL